MRLAMVQQRQHAQREQNGADCQAEFAVRTGLDLPKAGESFVSLRQRCSERMLSWCIFGTLALKNPRFYPYRHYPYLTELGAFRTAFRGGKSAYSKRYCSLIVAPSWSLSSTKAVMNSCRPDLEDFVRRRIFEPLHHRMGLHLRRPCAAVGLGDRVEEMHDIVVAGDQRARHFCFRIRRSAISQGLTLSR